MNEEKENIYSTPEKNGVGNSYDFNVAYIF